MNVGLVVVVALTLLVTGIPATADATGMKAFDRNAQGHIHHTPRVQGHIHFTPRTQGHIHFTPNTQAQPQHRPHGVQRHHAPVIVVPQPVYVTSPRRCVVPGYWSYTWVPQSYVSNVWVPGYYNSDALWVEAHYEPRAYTWGYYQPYWVPESWADC